MLDWLRRLVWNRIPYDAEVSIKSVVVPSFRNARLHRCRQLQNYIVQSKPVGDLQRKIRIVFVCSMPSVWNSLCSTFSAIVSDPAFKTYLIALPARPAGDWDGGTEPCEANPSYDFCKRFYARTIQAYNPGQERWFDLKKLAPDYIVLSRPYDREVPPDYRSDVLSRSAKLCYLPYSYCKMNWDSRQIYRCDFLDNVYAVFTENELYADMLRRLYRKDVKGGWKKILPLGYPRFDLYAQQQRHDMNRAMTVLWLPRWTTRKLLEPSTFFKYKDELVGFFQARPQLQLICRPHPLMLGNFLSTGVLSEDEVTDFRRLFAETDNLQLDESEDYLPALEEADVFISDTSSLLVEEFATGKPVIFCGSMAHFDRDAQRWAGLMYHVSDWGELSERLERLIAGEDDGKAAREAFIAENMNDDNNCGQRIADWIKQDFLKE